MEFKITEEEAREMARFEEEVGGDISAGPDWGVHLGSVMALALNQVDRAKLMELLHEQLGNVLSQSEIEEACVSVQALLLERVANKLNPSS